MVRNLRAQAEAIWPQEQSLLARYGHPTHIADIGCGSGEITSRLAALYPQAQIVGVDILESSAAYARRARSARASRALRARRRVRVEVRQRAVRSGGVPSHDPSRARARESHCRTGSASASPAAGCTCSAKTTECYRCRPARWIRIGCGMKASIEFTRRTHTDARIGRRTWAIMNDLGLQDLHVDYVIVDTLRVPRETFATIIQAWRDGYTEVLVREQQADDRRGARAVRSKHQRRSWIPVSTRCGTSRSSAARKAG